MELNDDQKCKDVLERLFAGGFGIWVRDRAAANVLTLWLTGVPAIALIRL